MDKNTKFQQFTNFLGNVASRGTNLVADNYKDIFKKKLKQNFKKIFIKSTIKYIIIFIGIFIVIFEPFKYLISNFTASVLFIAVFIWSFISAIKVIRNYYRLPCYIIKDKNIHDGTWKFINFKWPKIAKGIAGYNIVRSIGCLLSDNFKNMPEVENTVKDFLKYILKDLIIFCSFFALYFITVNIIVKPFLLLNFAGIHTWEVYLFPFIQVKNFILYLIG